MAVANNIPRLAPLTIHFNAAQRRRLEAVARSHGFNLETFTTDWIMAAVESFEGEPRAKSRGLEK